MSIIHVNHIQSNCRARFSSLIDMSDIDTPNIEDRESQFLTRALAAFSIAALAKIDDTAAAKAVVDEYHDDGIDAFYFDRTEHVAYLLQSKWVKNGLSTIDLGSMLKFIQGVNHFLEGQIAQLGPKMQGKNQDIQDALSDSQVTFVLVIGYTGKSPLAAEVRRPIDQLLNELNDDGDLVSLRELKQKELHDIVEQRALGESVDLTVLLHEWGVVREPYKVFYGQMDVADVTSWGRYGDHLYHKNIRGFKGSTEVNDSIVSTVKDAADNFFYFNNGITLLCSELEKQPLGGKSRNSGVFECKGASVINGAQTVGSIISALSVPNATSTARVMVRLISLEGCPPDFGFAVTRATNTQNKIEKRDFAALDEEQGRIRSEMLLSLGKDYVFRTGDRPPSPDKGCTLDDAAVALACANQDITYCMIAKREVSRLYEDIKKVPYVVLFNPGLSALKLWRSVDVLRRVDEFLRDEQTQKEGKERLVAIHGNRVLLFLVFRELTPTIFTADDADEELSRVQAIAQKCLEQLTTEITKNYSQSYPGQLFKNITKCKEIASAISIGR
jgi:hypothetical protein